MRIGIFTDIRGKYISSSPKVNYDTSKVVPTSLRRHGVVPQKLLPKVKLYVAISVAH